MFDDKHAVIMSDKDKERLANARDPKPEISYDPWGRPNPPAGMSGVVLGEGVTGYYPDEIEAEYGTATKQFPNDGDVGGEEKSGTGLWDDAQSLLGSVALVLLGVVLIILALLSTDVGMKAVEKL